MAEFIHAVVSEAGDDRLETRRQSEDQARKLLDESAGHMTQEQARALFELLNTDSKHGKLKRDRFSPAFVGQTANALISDLENFNSWTGKMWKGSEEERASAIGALLEDRKLLPSAGTSYPSMLAYLHDPERSAVWGRMTDRGLRRLIDYEPAKSPGTGGPAEYRSFCEAAMRLMDDYEIPPELLDVVLASAGRVEEQKSDKSVPKPATANVWLFQANPSIYNIDQALSELDELTWVVRQYKSEIRAGDRVYLWRAGADAGVVATATVEEDPAETAAPAVDDAYTLKPEAFAKSELRVRLRIDSALPEAVRRSDLLEHAVLKSVTSSAFPTRRTSASTLSRTKLSRRLSPASGSQRCGLRSRSAYSCRAAGFRRPSTCSPTRVRSCSTAPGNRQDVRSARPRRGATDGGDFRIVQFHPSYSYEDFVGGFRPVEDNGAHGVRYQRTDGPLRELAAVASADPRHPYVLIIDEINRGNIPKIFGELLFLLEYRD